MASKVFGYQRFPSKLFELDTDEASKNESSKRLKEVLEKNPALTEDESFIVRNNTYAVIPPVTVIYNTRAQTSLFRNVFLILQENNTNESYLECSFDHFNCKLTHLEHFIHDVYLIFNPIRKQKKKQGHEILWLDENFVQRFYNSSMTFLEFGDNLMKIFDFKSNTHADVVTLCWTIYHREIFFRLSGNTLVTQLEDENLRKLFEIFTHLDYNVMCKISPFLMNQFLTWWISESGFKLNKEVQTLTEWYNSVPKDSYLDFPEFTKQVYRLFLSGIPIHIYKTLIIDAWDCIVSGVIKKGLLEKVGPNKGRWLPRVMYLHVDKIEYFKRKTDGTLDSKGVIHLGPKSSVNEVFNEDKIGFFQLAVVCSENHRRYLLRSDDQRIRHIWVTSIQNVLDVMKGSTKPLVLEKPLKFVQDVGLPGDTGEIAKVRSFSTNESRVNTLNGNQLIFNRHSDDFSKHFRIDYSHKFPRSSSFTKASPDIDIRQNPRISVTSKRSSMSDCMDLTISPHPGAKTFFRQSIEETEHLPLSDDGDVSFDEDYESMSNHSCNTTPYVFHNLSNSMRPISESDGMIQLGDKVMLGMSKSQTIDDYRNMKVEPLPPDFLPEPAPRVATILDKPIPTLDKPIPTLDKPIPTLNKPIPILNKPIPILDKPIPTLDKPMPIPAPRQKLNVSNSSSQTDSTEEVDPVPKIPPRRIPKVPVRSSSKRKFQYENAEHILLNKL